MSEEPNVPDKEALAAADKWMSRVHEVASLNPRMAADYLKQAVRAAKDDLWERDDATGIAWLIKALSADYSEDDREYVAPTYEETATSTCIGYTASGARCARPSHNGGDGNLFLCAHHLKQSPHAWDTWRQAIYDISEYVTGAAATSRALLAHMDGDSVYFMSDGRFMKIGTSVNVPARLDQIVKDIKKGGGKGATICPPSVNADDLRVELVVSGGRKLEGSLHMVGYRWRLEGEWFTDCPELRLALSSAGVPITTNVRAA